MLTFLAALTFLGSAFGGFLVDPDIVRLLQSTQTGLYVVRPTHFLPISVLQKNFLQVPTVPESSKQENRRGGYDMQDNVSLKPPPPPKDEYGPPKSNSFGQDTQEHRPFRPSDRPFRPTISNRTPRPAPPPQENYLPPNSGNKRPPPKDDFFMSRDSEETPRGYYGAPKNNYSPPRAEYGPPKMQYDPPKVSGGYGPPQTAQNSQQTVIFKSYVEPTYSFGEIPLFGYVESSTFAPPRKNYRRREGYY